MYLWDGVSRLAAGFQELERQLDLDEAMIWLYRVV
jgi:hypothetical protein